MTLPASSPTIKIPLSNRDPNENTSTFRRLLESKRTLRCRTNAKKRPSNSSKQQKQQSQEEPCPASLSPPKDGQAPSSGNAIPPLPDLPRHFQQLEQQKKQRKETTCHSTAPKPRPNEPKLQLALNREYNNYRGREIFIHIDTPIFTLPTESMWTIFEHCGSFEDYHQIAGVCKKWRSLINAAPLWKDMAIQWTHLLAVIRAQCKAPHYDYISTLNVTGSSTTTMMDPIALRTTNVSFKHLRHMRIANINYTDVKFIMDWMRGLESVHCERISCSSGQNVSLRVFFDMPCLKSLKLDFVQEYLLAPTSYDFDTHGNMLPKSLQGIYDREVHTAVDNDGNRLAAYWDLLELQLVRKYSMLTSLTRLTSLTLGRISAFTSRVWLECFKPCAPRLEYLTLMNWPGAGKRESPLGTGGTPDDASERITEDSLQAAIAECFSSLKQVKEIYLDDFVCDIGVIDGISQLNTLYHIDIEGLHGQARQPYTVHDFKATKVFGLKISMLSTTRGDPAGSPCRDTKA
ncbi:hypothetical protein V8B55DRAFT_1570160 [Mucor lusitanicus]